MSFGKFGLLKGLGQGVAQAGDTLMKDKLDQMKEERLQAFQQKIQQQQFDRDDKVRGEDRQFAEETQARNLAFQSQAQVQGQQNWESEFGLRKDQFEQGSDLVKKQLEQMDQQIKITGMELGQVEARESLRQNILSETDPSRKQQLMGDYASMMSDFSDKPLTITAYGEMDEVSGQQTRTTMQWDAGARKWVPVMAGAEQAERPSLEELLGGQPQASSGPSQTGGSQPTPETRNGIVGPPDRYSMNSISGERGDTGIADRAAGLLRRITPNLQPEGQIEQIDARINMLMQRSDQPPIQNRQLDDQRLALTRLIQNPETSEEIKERAKQLFDRIR